MSSDPVLGEVADVERGPSQLAERIQAGERLAEDELARVFHTPVLVMMRSRTRDPEMARDLTQETLLAVLQALRAGHLRESEKLAAYVQGTSRNILNHFYRSRRRMFVPLSAEMAVGDSVVDLEKAERTRVVAGALGSLSPLDRHIVHLTMVEGLTPVEIAARVGLSSEAVRCRKCRALKRMAERIRPRTRPGQRRAR
jgi:RNA polymerase sigma-70 factor (ECF subfamily)